MTSLMTIPASSPELVPSDLHFDGDGTDGEQLVTPTQLNARLQWFNGLPTTSRESAIGFHIEAGLNAQLDETLIRMGARQYVVHHSSIDQNGETNQVPYWALNDGQRPCSLFVLSYGLKSSYEMNQDPADRCGIAYGWETLRDRDGQVVRKEDSDEPKRHCRLHFRAFIHELVAHGFTEWFQVSFRGYITEDVLTALREQVRVIETYNEYARRKDYRPAPFYGFSLPLVPGAMKMVGKGKKKSPIYPPLAQVPSQITGTYLLAQRIPDPLMQHIVEERLLEEMALWSIKRSREMVESDVQEGEDEPNERTTVPSPALVSAPARAAASAIPAVPVDPLVTREALRWITHDYCMGNRQLLHQVCARFRVADATQLRTSHADILAREAQQSESL